MLNLTPIVSVGRRSLSGIQLAAHHTYVETHGSMGARLFAKSRSPVEVLNDLDGEAFNLSHVLLDLEAQGRFLKLFDSWRWSREGDDSIDTDDSVARAVRFIQFVRQATSAIPAKRSHRKRFVLSRLDDPLGVVEPVLERLTGVQVEDEPVLSILARYDSPETLFLVDERSQHGRVEPRSDAIDPLLDRLLHVQAKVNLIVDDGASWLKRLSGWRCIASIPPHRDATGDPGQPGRTASVLVNYV